MMMYTEAKHHMTFSENILFDVGVFHRFRLGLGPNEVAKVVQVCFHISPGGVTEYFQALSPDPDEEVNLNEFTMLNDQNLIALRASALIGVTANGPIEITSLVVPVPGGIDVAGDVVYCVGTVLTAVNTLHGCSIYYERRKAKPGEREALIMAQR